MEQPYLLASSKLEPFLLKQSLKTQKKTKRIINYLSKCNLYLYFLIEQNLLITGGKMFAELKGHVTQVLHFLDLP